MDPKEKPPSPAWKKFLHSAKVQRKYSDFRQMCVLWMRENRPDVVRAFEQSLGRRYPSRKARVKLPKILPKP